MRWKPATKSDQYIRIRFDSDIPFLWGVLYHIFQNGWEDKQYIHDRVYDMEKVRDEVMRWTPEKVEESCSVPEADVYKAAETIAQNRPSTIVWCMGQTQHTIGNAMVRASCILKHALGKYGGGTNIFAAKIKYKAQRTLGLILIRCRVMSPFVLRIVAAGLDRVNGLARYFESVGRAWPDSIHVRHVVHG